MNQQSGFDTQAPDTVLSTAYQPVGQQQPEVRWYQRKWFVVLALLLFFPVGLVLLWTSPATRLSGRIVWTVVIALALLIRLGGGSGGPPAASTESAKATSSPTASAGAVVGNPGTQAAADPARSAATPEAADPTPPAATQNKSEFNLTVTDESTGVAYKGKVVSNVGFAVLDVATAKSVGSGFFVENATGGATFALVTVYVSNEQREALTLDSSLFTLVADGSEYEYSISATSAMEFSDQTESLFLKQLNPGLSVVATVPFEVPESLDLNRAELQFRPGYFGRAERVPLSPITE